MQSKPDSVGSTTATATAIAPPSVVIASPYADARSDEGQISCSTVKDIGPVVLPSSEGANSTSAIIEEVRSPMYPG